MKQYSHMEQLSFLFKGKAKGSSASQGLAYCNLLFEIEQGLVEKTAEERHNERLKQSKPVLDAMSAWANSRTAAPKSALGKAFTYLKEQWPCQPHFTVKHLFKIRLHFHRRTSSKVFLNCNTF